MALTGDLVERDPCIDWIPDTLGRLHAPGGVYYVLGNHDRRVNQQRLQRPLAAAGAVHVGGRWQQVTVRGVPLVIAGNELPWYRPAAELGGCPPHDAAGLPLRIPLGPYARPVRLGAGKRRRPDAGRAQSRRPGAAAPAGGRARPESIRHAVCLRRISPAGHGHARQPRHIQPDARSLELSAGDRAAGAPQRRVNAWRLPLALSSWAWGGRRYGMRR